jgi:cytochrome c biogenesis protein CcmG/thiol:disulfide interchange protein DsbE
MRKLAAFSILVLALAAGVALRYATTPARGMLPDLTLPSPEGPTLRTADTRGRVTLVNIWASWCAPCREELPALDSLAASFDTSRVVFLALSDDYDPVAARQFLLALPLANLRIGLGLGELRNSFGYSGLPFTALVDRDGRIVHTWLGYGGAPHLAAVAEAIAALVD